MAEYRIVDLDTYKRKTILEYFLSLSSPQTGFTVDVGDRADKILQRKPMFFLSDFFAHRRSFCG